MQNNGSLAECEAPCGFFVLCACAIFNSIALARDVVASIRRRERKHHVDIELIVTQRVDGEGDEVGPIRRQLHLEIP